MIKFRPIDEELKNLHEPLAVTISEEDDFESALDGFRVTNSGSVMIPSGLTKPYLAQRRTSTTSTVSTSHSSTNSYPAPTSQSYQDAHYQQNHQLQLQQQQQQLLQQMYYQRQQQLYHMQQQQQQQQQYQQAYYSNSLPHSLSPYQGGYSRPMSSSQPSSFPEYYAPQPMAPPQPPSYPGMSPMGTSPMTMGYSPMTYHQYEQHQHQQYQQGYNQQQYSYPGY